MRASQLRDLTRAYANGKLSREEYETERTRLIDDVVAGKEQLRYRQLDPGVTAAPRSRRPALFVIAAVLLTGLLGLALLVHFTNRVPGATRSSAAQPVAELPVNLLEALRVSNDWSDASLGELENAWTELTPFQRESLRRTAAYRRLRHETSQRLQEQEALLAAGEMEALVHAVRLREFGERLGFGLTE